MWVCACVRACVHACMLACVFTHVCGRVGMFSCVDYVWCYVSLHLNTCCSHKVDRHV